MRLNCKVIKKVAIPPFQVYSPFLAKNFEPLPPPPLSQVTQFLEGPSPPPPYKGGGGGGREAGGGPTM